MLAQLLNSHFAQLVAAWKKSKNNKYSDSDKQNYHDNLEKLFDILKTENFSSKSNSQKEEIKVIFDFFLTSLEFLDNSTVNSVPFELISCLQNAMKDWVDNFNEYIIVTSYGPFSFNPGLVNNKVYCIIEIYYNIKFQKKLIQINLPKHLIRDYLTNSVLYHELGHFVDEVTKITDPICFYIVNVFEDTSPILDNDKADILNYFPYLNNPKIDINTKLVCIQNHVSEYFADLFACQYVEKSAYNYLTYAASGHKTSLTHPATTDRVKIVDEFLSDSSSHNFVVKAFIDVVRRKTGKSLEKRYQEISGDDILHLIPCEITEINQLHYLFNLGWNIWLNSSGEFKEVNNMINDLKPGQIYQIINNLIEKSISNYIILETWEKNKPCT